MLKLSGPEQAAWKKAERVELDNITSYSTWQLVPRPTGKPVLSSRFAYALKFDNEGNVSAHKARFVVRGYEEPDDYQATFAPVARFTSWRVVMAMSCLLGLNVYQKDVKSAFLNAPCTEEIYIEQPRGYEAKGKESWALRLLKFLYGLRGAPRAWNRRFAGVLVKFGFKKLESDEAVFVLWRGDLVTIISTHVDDLSIATNDTVSYERLNKALSDEFQMKDLGDMKYYLGMHVERTADTLKLHQKEYVNKVVERFKKTTAEPVSTPSVPGQILSDPSSPLSADESKQMEDKPFRSATGSCMYAVVGTRPDVAYAVHALTRHFVNPSVRDWKAAMRVVRYLKGTSERGLVYSRFGNRELEAYCDSDWGSEKYVNRRSVGGYVVLLAGAAVSWRSALQRTPAQSSCEAEYIALAETVKEVIWLRMLLSELGFEQTKATPIYIDNRAARLLGEGATGSSTRSKHIDIRYHLIRHHVEEGTIALHHISTKENLADIFTKPLAERQHVKFTERMMGCQRRPR